MIATPSEAAAWPCPKARSFAQPQTHCRGPGCPIWRWQPLDAAILKPHITAEMKANGGDHKKATATVAANREALGLPTKPTHGYCGAGGEVRA